MSKEDKNNEVLKRLDELEKRIDEKIKKIESSLEKIEKSSALATDDQLFFGIVFALLILLFQLPEFDLCDIFKQIGISVEPSSGFITAKWFFISFLLFSSVSRYLTALTANDITKNKLRMISVSFLLGCIYFIIADWAIRALSALLTEINVFLLVLAPLALTFIIIIIGHFVEKRWNAIYGGKGAPIAFVFAYVGIAITVTYYIGMFVSLLIPLSQSIILAIIGGSFLLTYLLLRFASSRSNMGKKKEKVKK
ncbi:MAG: hypothetical protein WC325_02610 [Candidatus Bathyarchaeia archaeon]|jgi:hypothetical protein